jgi:hypothetical protein
MLKTITVARTRGRTASRDEGARLSSIGMPEMPLRYSRPLTLLQAKAVMVAAERAAARDLPGTTM